MIPGSQPPQLLGKTLFFQGRKFSYEVNSYRLPNGTEGTYECIRHPGGAVAVPVTTDGRLVLTDQYRFSVSGRLLEFPAGTIEEGEDPAAAVGREVEEEVGYHAGKITTLGKFPLCPGYSDEFIYAYLAQDLEALDTLTLDADEDINVVLMSPQEFEAAIFSGEPIADAKSIASYFLAKPHLSLS